MANRPVHRHLQAVAYGNNIFVAVGDGLTILTSQDGKTWFNHSSEIKNVTANINFSTETYAANGDAVTFAYSDIAQRPSSPDFSELRTNRMDLNEAERTALIEIAAKKMQDFKAKFPTVPRQLYAVAFGGGAFVIVGDCGEILTSHDGDHWIAPDSHASVILNAVVWGSSGFVAVGDKGTILTSPDGLSWTKRNSGTAVTLFGVAYGSETFVALGDNSTILTSSDGIQWTPTDIGPEAMEAIAFGNGLFMGTGIDTFFPGKMYLDSDQTMISTDGKIWRAVKHPYPPIPGQTGAMSMDGHSSGTTALAFGGGQFIAMSVEGIYTSKDGNSWKPAPGNYGFKSCYFGAAFGNRIFVAVGNGEAIGTNHNHTFLPTIATSNDKNANTWEFSKSPPSRLIWGSLESDKSFRAKVATARFGQLRLLPIDEDTWRTPDNSSISGDVYGNTVTFLYGNRPVVLSSKDGITWTRLAPIFSDHPTPIIASKSQSPAKSENGVVIELNGQPYKLNLTANIGQSMEIQASTNLVNWESLTTITNNGGVLKYIDMDVTKYPMRFYRLKLQ